MVRVELPLTERDSEPSRLLAIRESGSWHSKLSSNLGCDANIEVVSYWIPLNDMLGHGFVVSCFGSERFGEVEPSQLITFREVRTMKLDEVAAEEVDN